MDSDGGGDSGVVAASTTATALVSPVAAAVRVKIRQGDSGPCHDDDDVDDDDDDTLLKLGGKWGRGLFLATAPPSAGR